MKYMEQSKINLPSIYTREVWERSKNPFNEKYIGKPYISWSQIETFRDKAGFNTGLLGEFEYILSKLSKIDFGDMGWGQFGSEAEAYITLRKLPKKKFDLIEDKVKEEFQAALVNFTDKEKKVMDTIKPLGVFQDEICYYVEEYDFIVLGYIDDRSPEVNKLVKMVRDYKTKSESSKKDLHDEKKYQIDIYVGALKQRGLEVEGAEYCIIERLGGRECMGGGGRESLSIGDRVWYEPYKLSDKRLKQMHEVVIDTALRVSNIYTTYQKFFE